MPLFHLKSGRFRPELAESSLVLAALNKDVLGDSWLTIRLNHVYQTFRASSQT
jgi:hypothetical protein